jgi:hypothetical protein
VHPRERAQLLLRRSGLLTSAAMHVLHRLIGHQLDVECTAGRVQVDDITDTCARSCLPNPPYVHPRLRKSSDRCVSCAQIQMGFWSRFRKKGKQKQHVKERKEAGASAADESKHHSNLPVTEGP